MAILSNGMFETLQAVALGSKQETTSRLVDNPFRLFWRWTHVRAKNRIDHEQLWHCCTVALPAPSNSNGKQMIGYTAFLDAILQYMIR
jgi:hypothetical protein